MSPNPTSALPPLYSRWIDQVLAGGIPEETAATCSDCAMCAKDGEDHSGSGFFFNPETKCCTYVPTLPNYLAGRILGDEDAAFATGRMSVEARLRAGVAVTPLGLGMPPAFSLLYAETGPRTFGKSKAMRCPHYLADDGGRCGVWKHRAAVCATWYCKHDRGAVGARFWKSLHQLLSAVERCLSRWCVVELDIGAEALAVLFPAKESFAREHQLDALALDGKVDRRLYAKAWGKWSGRELEFYREAARLVEALDWQNIIAIGGPELKIFERLVGEAYGKLTSAELPPALRAGNTRVFPVRLNSSRVVGYSPLDPLEVPQRVMSALQYFDGYSTLQSMAAIEKQDGLRLSPGLVRKLADFEILVPAEGSSSK